MANFAIASSQETIERANRIMGMYQKDGEKKEDTFLRILDLAERESIRGTHPELESSLRSIDGTIATLIKQINGIVSGQDLKVAELTDQLNAAVSEKQVALEAAKTDMDAANLLKSNVQKEIEDIRKVSQAQIAKAEQERDAAIRERNDARTIAAEKTKNNELLKQQIEGMKIDFDQKLEIAILKEKVKSIDHEPSIT